MSGRGLVGRDVDQHRAGQRVLGQGGAGLGGRGRAPARRHARSAAPLLAGDQRRDRRAATARPGRRRSRCDRSPPPPAARRAPVAPLLPRRAGPPFGDDLGQRAPDLAEAQQHHVDVLAAARGAAADLGQLEGIVDGPLRGRARPWPPTTNEMFSSDEPWAMATMLTLAVGQGAEHARGDAGVAGHADAHHGQGGQAGLDLDAVDLLARDLVAELLGQPHRAHAWPRPRERRSRSTAPTTTARSARR